MIMGKATRTKRTIQNSRMSLLLFLLQIFVGFYSRKVFLDYLGAEVLGVNTTLGNILSFLNLSELGIGIAMSTSLYKPIQNRDKDGICEIISVQGFLYRRIAMLLCCLSIPILIAMPWIFPSVECGIGYVYFAYIVFLSGSLSGYLWNYRQILIGADQKNYKLQPWIHAVRYIKTFSQIFLLVATRLGIWGWIVMELISNVISVFVINYVLHREYPWLQNVSIPVKELLKKYHWLIVKTKQIFVHKIALFVLEQTSPLIIYALISITMVTYYSNYMVLIGYTTMLMNVIFSGMGASIGSLVAENNKRHTMEVFWELFTSRVWLSGVACFTLFVMVNSFITFWIGEKYLLDESTILIMIVIMFIRVTRTVTDSFNHAFQLFGDVWSAIIEAIINLGLSLLLGYIWGLNGILMGVAISLFVICLFWKPYYLFSRGLEMPTRLYYIQYVLHVFILGASAFFTLYLASQIEYDSKNIIDVAIHHLFTVVVYVVITYGILYVVTSSMRRFSVRMLSVIKKK